MSVSFDQMPRLRRGGIMAEFNASAATSGTPAQPHAALLVCPCGASGTLTTSTPERVFAAADGDALCGVGSLGARMIQTFKANAPDVELWAIRHADTGQEGQGQVALSLAEGVETTTSVGTLALYVGGDRVAVSIPKGKTVVEAAEIVATEINADPNLLASAEANEGTVTLKGKTLAACAIDVCHSNNEGEARKLPGGLVATCQSIGGGTGDFDAGKVIDAIAAIDGHFSTIVFPSTDAAELNEFAVEIERLSGPKIQRDGILFSAIAGTLAEATTLGAQLNSNALCVVAAGDSPTPACIWATALAAVDARECGLDPGRPRKTLRLDGVLAFKQPWDGDSRESALHGGITPCVSDTTKAVRVERLITTYQRNAIGAIDTAYLDVTTCRLLSYLRYSWNQRISTKFPRHKLLGDDAQPSPGVAVVQPRTIRAESLALHAEWELAGHVQDFDGFKASLIVEIDESDPSRVNMVMSPKVCGEFMTLATRIDFRK